MFVCYVAQEESHLSTLNHICHLFTFSNKYLSIFVRLWHEHDIKLAAVMVVFILPSNSMCKNNAAFPVLQFFSNENIWIVGNVQEELWYDHCVYICPSFVMVTSDLNRTFTSFNDTYGKEVFWTLALDSWTKFKWLHRNNLFKHSWKSTTPPPLLLHFVE